jgi:secreted trypsin-like serine protease
MKVFVFVFLALTAVSAFRLEPTYEREGGRTPWSERQYLGPSPFIVRGDPAEISQFPHMLVLLDLTRGGFICGASAISSRWSLTAAHCLERNTPAQQIQLRGGSTNRNTGGFIFQAQTYSLHPQYNSRTLANDVAAIQVQAGTPIQGLHVAHARLPGNCATACCTTCDPDNVIVKGWGRDENGQFPLLLRQLTAPIHNHADCGRLWSGIGSNFFCKSVINGADSCNGDSGSPLVRADARDLQVGLVSFGTSVCGDGTRPSVNVRIEDPVVRNWIRTFTGI